MPTMQRMNLHAIRPGQGEAPELPPPGVQKAMAVLNALDGETLQRVLKHLDKEDLARISAVDMELEPVAAEEFEAIVQEFTRAFANRLRMMGDYRKPSALLQEVLSEEELASLGESSDDEPVWRDDRFANTEVLVPMAQREHPQLVAFMLSRVEPDLGVEVVRQLDAALGNEILLRLLDMRPVQPSVAVRVEQHIRVTIIDNAATSRSTEARARIAGIINRMDKEFAEKFLETLKQERPDEAAEIRRMLFSFEDVAKLSEQDRLILFDEIPAELTVKALHNAPEELVNVVLEALGGRMRKMVEAELSGGAAPPEEESVKARLEIASRALELAQEGRITIDLED